MITLTAATDESLEFEITSSTRDSTHNVYWDKDNGWICTCEHCYYRKVECKHIAAVKEYLQSLPFTIVGVTVNRALVYNKHAINHVTHMGVFYEIKKQKQEKELILCKHQEEMKLKI